MKRKVFAFVLSICLLLSLPMSASAELNEDVRNSVVVVGIGLDTASGTISLGHGSGFFVNDQYLITNHHVINSFLEYGAGEQIQLSLNETPVTARAVIRVYYDGNDYEEAYIVGHSETKDIAIIRLDKPTDKRTPLVLKVPTEDMVGSTIYAVGYPGLADNATADSTKFWGKYDATVTSGTISRLITTSGTGNQNVQIDCNIKSGNSGGPVVDPNGYVIGVATWGVTDWDVESQDFMERVKYAVNISEAILLMDQHSVDYTMAEAASSERDGVSPVLLAGAGAVVVLVVAIVLLLKKKSQKKPQPVQMRPTVRSYSQLNYGMAVQILGRAVILGRSSACDLRFPEDAPGISGNHCSIQWDSTSEDFIVMDMNSSYGTFLMSGERMVPNHAYRLRSGDRFYLAEQRNVVSLTLE